MKELFSEFRGFLPECGFIHHEDAVTAENDGFPFKEAELGQDVPKRGCWGSQEGCSSEADPPSSLHPYSHHLPAPTASPWQHLKREKQRQGQLACSS